MSPGLMALTVIGVVMIALLIDAVFYEERKRFEDEEDEE